MEKKELNGNSKATKERKKRITLLELYESQSKFILYLEKRILNLESQLQNHFKISRTTFIGSEALAEKQNFIYFNSAVESINNYYNIKTIDWLNKSRKDTIIEIRYIFFWILIYKYNIINFKILSKLLKDNNYAMDRTTFYHVIEVYENCLDSKDVNENKRIKKYNEIINIL